MPGMGSLLAQWAVWLPAMVNCCGEDGQVAGVLQLSRARPNYALRARPNYAFQKIRMHFLKVWRVILAMFGAQPVLSARRQVARTSELAAGVQQA